MGIEHYTTPEALALLKRIGWPEWTSGEDVLSVQWMFDDIDRAMRWLHLIKDRKSVV